ncbi:MAG: LysM peptidoglycan-binding domain-containing protein [Chloroflexota bacterium]
MNFVNLLIFIPLGIGVAWLFYLIFRQDLAAKPLTNILSYFLGVLIIVVVVGWLIDTMLPNWLNSRLQNAQTSVELREFVDTTTVLIEDSVTTGSESNQILLPAPTQVILFPEQQSTPQPGGSVGLPGDEGQADVESNSQGLHTVVAGDTLSAIADQYGVSIDALRQANNRFNDLIFVGEQLIIPAGTTTDGK